MPINHVPLPDSELDSCSKEKKPPQEKTQHFLITEPQNTFDDVILPDHTRWEIDQFLSLSKNRDLIFDRWGLSAVIRHHNDSINLYGESGTGKTLTAHAIASALGQKMVIVNYAEVESKYVGETSKNLMHLFDFAQKARAVILFDEADALLSKRVTAMNTAADVSVNQTRNVLLKILDCYDGTVIFTTNFIQNFDPAFMRRIFTHVKFDLPDAEARKRLWEHYLVPQLPIIDRETVIETLSARSGLTGADISTAVLKAATVAASSESQYLSAEILEKSLDRIQSAKNAVSQQYEVTTRRVSKEYALSKLDGGVIHGTDQ